MKGGVSAEEREEVDGGFVSVDHRGVEMLSRFCTVLESIPASIC